MRRRHWSNARGIILTSNGGDRVRVLLVEDDRDLSRAVVYRLKKEGMDVTACGDGPEGCQAVESQTFDLVILDRMLPGVDGVWILKRMRAAGNATPTLLLTAMDAVEDRVAGLDAGADDYLVKPFAMDELMARVRALARRRIPFNPLDIARAADLTLDRKRLTLSCGERSATLSRRESDLMEFLINNYGQVLTRAVIMDRVWSDSYVDEGNLEIYVHYLRRHLRAIQSKSAIKTLRSVGYELTNG